MNFVTVLGLAAATLTTIAFLPQVIKTWTSKSAKDLSLVTLVTFNTGVFLWLVYGIYIHDLPVMMANLVTFILNLIITFIKIRYKS